jgi:hypothetical protein
MKHEFSLPLHVKMLKGLLPIRVNAETLTNVE